MQSIRPGSTDIFTIQPPIAPRPETVAPQKVPVKSTEFSDSKSAIEHVGVYMTNLNKFAEEFEAKNGRKPKDQDFPVEVIKMLPPNPKAPSALIIGGMGPLAGAQAMDAALRKFGDEREVVLVQLCSTPDRTGALGKDRECNGISKEHTEVVDALATGFATAQEQLSTTHLGNAHMVVACNTSHNFVPDAFEKYKAAQGANAAIESESLIDCVSARLKGETKPVLILGTDGTRKTRLYTGPLTRNGINCIDLDDKAQGVLMSAIYQGVKAFDAKGTLVHGQQLFDELESSGRLDPKQGCIILSACTEVPEILSTLKQHGSDGVKQMLAGVEVVDPVTVTLEHVSAVDAQRALTAPVAGTLVDPGAKY